MEFNTANTPGKRYKVMTPEQFSQIVEAISLGRYSWACVLILRFVGYNPLHFIPYRTYNRLLKDNRSTDAMTETAHRRTLDKKFSMANTNRPATGKSLTQIDDLAHVEPVDRHNELHGGNVFLLMHQSNLEYRSTFELLDHQSRQNFHLDWESTPMVNLK